MEHNDIDWDEEAEAADDDYEPLPPVEAVADDTAPALAPAAAPAKTSGTEST